MSKTNFRWPYIALGCVTLMVGIEIGLRLVCGLGSPALVYKDPLYSYAFVPNQSIVRFGHRIKYNRQGLRSDELNSRPRILCLGDSVTNGGASIDQLETYPNLLESDLGQIGRSVQVLNASAGGWAPANEYAWLARFGIYESRIVVLQIGTHDLWQDKADSAAVGSDPNFPDRRPRFAVEELIVRYLLPSVEAKFAGPIIVTNETWTKERLDRNLGIISGMINYAKSHGAIVFLLLTPNREEIEKNADYLQRRQSTVADGRASIIGLCRKSGVTVVDMLGPLMKNWRPNLFRDGVHPSGTGNHVIARVLASSISNLM